MKHLYSDEIPNTQWSEATGSFCINVKCLKEWQPGLMTLRPAGFLNYLLTDPIFWLYVGSLPESLHVDKGFGFIFFWHPTFSPVPAKKEGCCLNSSLHHQQTPYPSVGMFLTCMTTLSRPPISIEAPSPHSDTDRSRMLRFYSGPWQSPGRVLKQRVKSLVRTWWAARGWDFRDSRLPVCSR